MFCIIVFLVFFYCYYILLFVYLGRHCKLLNPPLQLVPTSTLGTICTATREPPTIEPLAPPPGASARYLAYRGIRRFKPHTLKCRAMTGTETKLACINQAFFFNVPLDYLKSV
jgi:hypothetical protein